MPVVQLQHVGRRVRVKWWAVGVVALWLGLVATFELLKPAGAEAIKLCRMKAWTGLPCPTCGLTRATLAAGHGQFIDALLYNPFMVVALALAVGWLVLRLTTGRTVQLNWSRRGRAIAWCSVAALFIANWLYLITRGI